MKTEERKQLQQNSLLNWLGRMKESFKSGPSKRTMVVCTVLVLAVILFVGFKIYSNYRFNKNSSEWMALYRASPDDPADRLKTLAKISQEQAGSVQGRIAQLTLARTKLEEGMSEIYVNETEDDAIKKYEEAQKKLKEAKEQFVALIGELREPKILNQESILGAAQAAEGLGNFDEALKYYGQLQNKYPNSLYAERAKEKTEYIKAHRAELDQLVKSLKPEEKKDTGTSTDTNKDEKKDTGTSTDTNKDEKNKNTTEDSKKEDGTKEDSKKEEKDNIEKK